MNPVRMFILLAFAHLSGHAVAEDELLLELHPAKTRVYRLEAISVTVSLLSGATSPRDIRYPRLSGAAYRVGDFGLPRQSSVLRDGRKYTAQAFSATLMPRQSGEYSLGPAELDCEVLAPARGAAAFFGGLEPHRVTLRSPPVPFTVLPLPRRGRPAEYNGAVGQFSLVRRVTPVEIHRGDPVTLSTRIAGAGNLEVFSCGSISLPGVRAYPVRAHRNGRHLDCEQVLLPDSAVLIPEARIHFFDPVARHYRTVVSPPLHLALIPPAPTPVPIPKAAKASPPSWPNWLSWGVIAMLVSSGALLRRRQVPVGIVAARPWLQEAEAALAANDPERFYTACFRQLQVDAAAHWQQPSAGLAGPCRQDARQSRYTELFRECDAVRYGHSLRGPQEMAQTLERLRSLAAAASDPIDPGSRPPPWVG